MVTTDPFSEHIDAVGERRCLLPEIFLFEKRYTDELLSVGFQLNSGWIVHVSSVPDDFDVQGGDYRVVVLEVKAMCLHFGVSYI